MQEQEAIARERNDVAFEWGTIAAEHAFLKLERAEIASLRAKLSKAIRRMFAWLKRPDLIEEAPAEA